MDPASFIRVVTTDDTLSHLTSADFGTAPLKAALALAFISPHVDFSHVVTALQQCAGSTPVVAISTAGELCAETQRNTIYQNTGTAWNSVIVQIFPADLLASISIHKIPLHNDDIRQDQPNLSRDERVQRIAQSLQSVKPPFVLDAHDTLALTFIDGLSSCENYFMEAVYRCAQFPCLFVGGSSGGKLDFKHTYIFDGQEIVENHAVVIFIKLGPNRNYGVFKSQNFKKTGKFLTVVEADPDRRLLMKVINPRNQRAESALTVMAEMLDTSPAKVKSALTGFTFGIEIEGEIFVRSVADVNVAADTMLFFCDINPGDRLELLAATDFVAHTTQDISTFLRGKPPPLGAVLNDCILRRLNNEASLSDMVDLWPMPVAGFSTFGELFGININQSLTAVVFFDTTEAAYSDPYITAFPIHYSRFLNFFTRRDELSQANLITTKMKLEGEADKLRAAKDKAVAENQAKSEFLANMSHELRTPLNSILGMLRLLKEAGLTTEDLGLVDTALNASSSLLEIVNDILDLSKIESGEMQLEQIGLDLGHAIDNTIDLLRHNAEAKRIPIIHRMTSDKLPYVLGDPIRFTRILMNLIGNAIKYTDKGKIEIRSSAHQLNDTQIEFRCEIEDSGIGIPSDKLHRIFEKFVQGDSSTTRQYGGTGLGLAITKHLIELMGGTIGVTSEPYVGSTFWFTIPYIITDHLNEEKYAEVQKLGSGIIAPDQVRILVAEDHPMNQILITKILQRFGIVAFEIVDNGVDALVRYHKAPWDIILMDCHMPKKNGYDTTTDIREHERNTPAHIPIVAMTANAMAGEREKCLLLGMDAYISKPIDFDAFKAVLSQWIKFPIQKPNEITNEPIPEAPLDLSVLREFTEGDHELECQLIDAFVIQSDLNLAILAENCTAIAPKIWVEPAHMMKGGAASMGAKKLSELCHQAQIFAGTWQEQTMLFQHIDAEYKRVKGFLRESGLLK